MALWKDFFAEGFWMVSPTANMVCEEVLQGGDKESVSPYTNLDGPDLVPPVDRYSTITMILCDIYRVY